MDKVYYDFLAKQGKENTITCKHSVIKEIWTSDEKNIGIYQNLKINITEIDSQRRFISNTQNKGILVEKLNCDVNFDFCKLYKDIVSSFGCIKDLYNFQSKYFENIAELFTYDQESIGLGEWNLDYENKVKKLGISPDIKASDLYTFAYEANGNRWLMDFKGDVFLYANDPNYKEISILKNYPKYTFYEVNGIKTVENFFMLFLQDFAAK